MKAPAPNFPPILLPSSTEPVEAAGSTCALEVRVILVIETPAMAKNFTAAPTGAVGRVKKVVWKSRVEMREPEVLTLPIPSETGPPKFPLVEN